MATLEVLPLTASEFKAKYDVDTEWSEERTLIEYHEYLTQNVMFHHYGGFGCMVNWFVNQTLLFLRK